MIRKAKVCLVYCTPFGIVYEHIGIASIGAYIKERGYDVKLICLEESPDAVHTITEIAPDIVGFNTVTSNLEKMLDLAFKLKSQMPVFTVLGRIGVSGNPVDIMKNYEEIDAIVLGEGEITFYELIERVT